MNCQHICDNFDDFQSSMQGLRGKIRSKFTENCPQSLQYRSGPMRVHFSKNQTIKVIFSDDKPIKVHLRKNDSPSSMYWKPLAIFFSSGATITPNAFLRLKLKLEYAFNN